MMMMAMMGISFADINTFELSNEKVFYDGDTVITTKVSTEENFIRSLAEKEGISYDEAEKLNASILLHSGEGVKSLDEAIGYKSVESISDVDDTNVETLISTEVQYVYNTITREAIEILNIGTPYTRVVNNVEGWDWDYSSPNIYNFSTSARISITGSVYVEVVESVAIGLGIFDVWSSTYTTTTTRTYWSPAVTQVMNIYLYQLSN